MDESHDIISQNSHSLSQIRYRISLHTKIHSLNPNFIPNFHNRSLSLIPQIPIGAQVSIRKFEKWRSLDEQGICTLPFLRTLQLACGACIGTDDDLPSSHQNRKHKEKESLITELRKELRMLDEELRELLSRVKADDMIQRGMENGRWGPAWNAQYKSAYL
ncbi:hypothetical protein V6N12_015901 [Hibiscus sabdariffa]|uniref:ENT domain-containing protein n=1 Tax=Hibiscus sabdariffa TaxID=183260 RepID=A0ABR2DPI1_9ROSI